MKKVELRKKYKELRGTLSSDEVFSLSEQIFKNFLEYFKERSFQHVHLFLSIDKLKEVDTRLFIEYFSKQGAHFYVPKMINDQLIALEIDSNTPLIRNSWGILEPEGDVDSGREGYDIILTPLLYCDPYGNRIGYGKGFYDGFFRSLTEASLKIGLGFFSPEEKVDDASSFDVPIDYLVTPTEVLSFKDLL